MTPSNLEKLIAAWLDGRIDQAGSDALQQELRDSAEAREVFRTFTELDAAIREVADMEGAGAITKAAGAGVSIAKPLASLRAKLSLATAAAIIIALAGILYFQGTKSEGNPIRITGLNGSLIWIGDGGQIVQETGSSQSLTRWSNALTEGAEVSGGTIEGVAPESWFKLDFQDGSTCMVAGDSILTFSDHGQKILRLKQGRFSSTMAPQPKGKPARIHTPAAVLTIVGTKFDVEAGPDSTMLYVREGKVQICRLSDGKTVNVLAKHRVLVTADSEMALQRVSPERTWAQTPVWENISPSADPNSNATQEIRDYDKTRNLLVSESPASLPAQDTGYVIRTDDLFEIRYVWMGGTWWTAHDQVAIRLFTTDNNLISGTQTTFATILSGKLNKAGAYKEALGSATATEAQRGKRLFVAIDTHDGGGERDGFAHLDNFQMQVTHFPGAGSPRLDDFKLEGMSFSKPTVRSKPSILIGQGVRNGDFNQTQRKQP